MTVEVDPEALRGLGKELANLLGMLSQLQIHDIDCDRRFVGHSGLANSYDSFTERWGVGVANLVSDADTMCQRLIQAADQYQQHDAGVARNLRSLYDDIVGDRPR